MRNDVIRNGGLQGNDLRNMNGTNWDFIGGFCLGYFLGILSVFCMISRSSTRKFKIGIYFGILSWFLLNL